MRKLTVKKHPTGFYRVMAGQQTMVDVKHRLTIDQAKKVAALMDANDGKSEKDSLTWDEAIAQALSE